MSIGLPMPFVVDYSVARPGAAAIKAAGGVGVVRYLSPGRTDGTNIDQAEIADFAAHGLPYALVMEFEATWILRGYQQGHDLATEARTLEQQLGIPAGVMYAAADWDIGPSQYAQALTTLHGMADGYGSWSRVGAYGSSQFCDWVAANSPITRFWSTDAWSGGYVSPHSALHQRATWAPGVPVVQGCDFNDVLGDWAPRTASTDWFDMATEADLENAVRKVLNEATGVGQQNYAGTVKALLATCQGLGNSLKTVIGALQIVIAGGNGNAGLKQVHDMLAQVQANPAAVDQAALETAVNTAVTAALANLTLKAA